MIDWQKALSERAKTISRNDDARLILRAILRAADHIRELEAERDQLHALLTESLTHLKVTCGDLDLLRRVEKVTK